MGSNVTLVFNSALNIVQLLEPLLFVNVVQLLFRPKFAKMGCSGKNFAGAAFGGAKNQNPKCCLATLYHLLGGGSLLGKPIFVKMHQIWPKVNRNRVMWGLIRPQEALLLFRQLNVTLLLFANPIVVLLLLLTIRTVFRAQR